MSDSTVITFILFVLLTVLPSIHNLQTRINLDYSLQPLDVTTSLTAIMFLHETIVAFRGFYIQGRFKDNAQCQDHTEIDCTF